MDQEDVYSGMIRALHEADGGKSSWIVFLVGSLGDSALAASLLPAFREAHPGRLMVVHPPHVSPLFDALGVTADTFVAHDMMPVVIRCRHLVQQLSGMFVPGLPIVCLPFYYGNLWRATTNGVQDLAQNFREILRLHPDAPIRYYAPGRPREAGGSRRVLLSPLTNSVPSAPHSYWGTVAELLQMYGFEVSVNLAKASEASLADATYPGCERIACTVSDILTECDQYAALVGHPSGLSHIQSMIPGETPLVWVNSMDPSKPYYQDRNGEVRYATKMQEFGVQGTVAQRPVIQLNSFVSPPEAIAEAVMAAALP